MKWWVKCIPAVIAKTASRSVAFKALRVRDSIMEGQDEFIMCNLDVADVGFREDYEYYHYIHYHIYIYIYIYCKYI